MKLLTNVITQRRLSKGWSQTDLARATGLSRPFISQIESGAREASPVAGEAIAGALGTTIDVLMGIALTNCPECGGQTVCRDCGFPN